MVGNVGSGKSTWIKKFLSEQKDEHTGEHKDERWAVVSKDAIRWMLGGGDKYIFDENLEDLIELETNEMIEGLLDRGVNVIVDETNGDVLSRRNIFDVTWPDIDVTAVCMPFVPRLESLKRKSNPDANYGTSQEVWDIVWRKKNDQFVIPTVDEGFDEILYVST
jgi:predicted kinase